MIKRIRAALDNYFDGLDEDCEAAYRLYNAERLRVIHWWRSKTSRQQPVHVRERTPARRYCPVDTDWVLPREADGPTSDYSK